MWGTMKNHTPITLAGENSVPLALGRWTSDLTTLASFGAQLPGGFLLAFGRQLWSQLSNGQMPPGLYDLRESAGLKLLGENLLMPSTSGFDATTVSFSTAASGNSSGISDDEPDFEDGSYLLVLKGRDIPALIAPRGVESRSGSCGPDGLALFLSSDFIALEDLADAAARVGNGLEAALFFAPSPRLSQQLSDKLRDKERIRDPFADIRSC